MEMISKLEKTLQRMERADLIAREKAIWNNGCFVWLPDGMRWKEHAYSKFIKLIEEKGYNPLHLPRMIPRRTIEKVKNSLMDFTKGVYWLSVRRGEQFSDSGWYLNSTSDPVIHHFISEVLKHNHKILPFRGYVREQLYRPHSSSARPFINADEGTDVIEAYNIQLSKEECFASFEESITIMEDFFDSLNVSYLVVDQPIKGNKPVSRRVVSLQTYLPALDCSTRVGTVYMHDDIFSKIFGLFIKNNEDKKRYGHEVCLGFGERFLLALLEHHADEYG